MELDDLKNTWQDISNQAENQQKLNAGMIDDMTRNRYRSKVRRIALPEMTGALVCFAGAVYIGFNFGTLDTLFYQGAGIITILLLVGLPLISLASIHQLKMPGDVSRSYGDALKDFAARKIRFCKLQKLNFILSNLLLATAILLSTRLFGKSWVSDSKFLFIVSFSIGYIILLFFSKWVWKRYNNVLRQAEDLLKEIGPLTG